MKELMLKNQQAKQRAQRVRSRITGTPDRPRLSVDISNRHVSAQLIDDTTGRTLGAISTVNQTSTAPLSQKAAETGKAIAQVAKKLKIKQVVLDRGSQRYHKRLHALAEAARKEGLEF